MDRGGLALLLQYDVNDQQQPGGGRRRSRRSERGTKTERDGEAGDMSQPALHYTDAVALQQERAWAECRMPSQRRRGLRRDSPVKSRGAARYGLARQRPRVCNRAKASGIPFWPWSWRAGCPLDWGNRRNHPARDLAALSSMGMGISQRGGDAAAAAAIPQRCPTCDSSHSEHPRIGALACAS